MALDDVHWERSFAGYLLYFEDLAGFIGGAYGLADSVAAGVHEAVLSRPAAAGISRRPPDADRAAALEDALARSWSHLSRAHDEVVDPVRFDTEANALLPTIVFNSVGGRSRRNVSRAEKEAIAGTIEPTTFFDILWRTRQESFSDGIDRFVVGAPDECDARRFAEALVIVADATVAAIEAVIAATVGVPLLADMTEELLDRSGIPMWSRLGHHAASFRARTASW